MLEKVSPWTQTHLSDLVQSGFPIVYGIVQAGPEVSDGVPYIKSTDVGGQIKLAALCRTSAAIAHQYRRSTVVPGDIVISLRGNIGELSIVPETLPEANLTQGTARIRVGPLAVNEFVAHALKSPVMLRHLYRVSKGSTFQEISLEELRRVSILLPPLEEQRKIAEILRTWDEAIDATSRLITTKRRRLHAARAELLKQTRAVGGGRAPNTWQRTTFGAAFRELRVRNQSFTDADVITVGKYAIRKQSDHFKRSVASKDLSPYWVMHPGNFVYDPMSAYYGAIGRFDAKASGIVSPAYRVLALEAGFSSAFMVELLKLYHIRFQLDALSSQGNKEGKRRSLQRAAFDSVEFFAPPIEEQQRLAKILADFAREVDLSEQHCHAHKRQKRGLMQQLLTGEWRVNPTPFSP